MIDEVDKVLGITLKLMDEIHGQCLTLLENVGWSQMLEIIALAEYLGEPHVPL